MSRESRYCDHLVYVCLALFAFLMPLSAGAGRVLLAPAALAWALKIILEKRFEPGRTPLDCPVLFMLLTGVLGAFAGFGALTPAGLWRYWPLLTIYIVSGSIRETGRVRMLAGMMMAGAAAASARGLWRFASEFGVGALPGSVGEAGQLTMISAMAAAGLLYEKERRGKLILLPAFLLPAALAALVMLGPREEGAQANFYLRLLSETGVPGLAAFLWLAAVFLVLAFRMFLRTGKQRPYEKSFALGVFASCAGFLLSGFFRHAAWDSKTAMTLFFLMGMALVLDRRSGSEEISC